MNPRVIARELLAALSGQAQGPAGHHLQEGRSGNIIRVADMKYLTDTRQHPALFVSPTMAKMVESLGGAEFFGSDGLEIEDLYELANSQYQRLGEANSLSALSQLARAGIQVTANDWYLRTPVSWTGYVREVSSNKRQEFYAPLHRSRLPRKTSAQQPYKESKVTGEDIELINAKYMGGESFDMELFEDDQTGQIGQRAQALGEGQRLIEEITVAARLMGVNLDVADFQTEPTAYRTYNSNGTKITTPYSVNLYKTGTGNRPATFAQLSAVTFKKAMVALMGALDPNGVKILVRPDHLVVSTQDSINARTLVESEYWPAVQGLGGETASTAAAGGLAGAFAKNTFKGLVTFDVNYFMKDWAWTLLQKQRGLVFQRRSPMEVVQENPMSGKSFDLDQLRWRSRSRWACDWIDSRFAYLGNDGSVTGNQ